MGRVFPPHDPEGVMKHAGRYQGGKALVILGGPSAGDGNWEALKEELEPDVVIGVNATCLEIKNLDYWMIAENMHAVAGKPDERSRKFMRMFTEIHSAKTKLVSCLSWDLLEDKTNSISIQRMGEASPDGYDEQIKSFNFREYGVGYLHGPMVSRAGVLNRRVRFRVGTVAAHAIHHAGILGCSEVHTIGMDFCFKDENRHHWYDHPKYQADRFRTPSMFTTLNGTRTQWDWIEGMQFFASLEPLFKRDGLEWRDHSHGLFEAEGLWCSR